MNSIVTKYLVGACALSCIHIVIAGMTGSANAPCVNGNGIENLYDGKLNPTAAWKWNGKPIEIETDFGEERDISGVRWWSGRSWISKGIRRASFWVNGKQIGKAEFRPAHTFKDSFATWKNVKCRKIKMTVETIWNTDYGYYMWYMHLATPLMTKLFDSPPYTINNRNNARLEIAELEYFSSPPSIAVTCPLDGRYCSITLQF